MIADPPPPADPPQSRTRRLADLVAEALDQSPPGRESFIRERAGDDADLAAEAISLVAAASEAGGFLHGATIAPERLPAIDAAAPSAIAEGAGQSIGPYRLLQQIGEGGFGVVFMAEQREPVRRKVALKIIKLGMDTRAVVARFEAERQALALMDHPGIARVFDAGSTASGRPYFVMELVRGDPIVAYCDRHNLPTAQRLELFIEVCRAVQHAHTKGVIHRDLKPGNVLVTVVDGRPVPKIIDFGIAKATSSGARLTDKTLFTEFRQVIGTPAYMSPEQADNAAADVDTRSDVYSLGVLLYELLTGVTPFDPKRLHSAAWGEMQRIIREEDPPRPSTRLSTLGEQLTATASRRSTEPHRLSSIIRGDLDWIVMRCLEKDRTRRYQTAEALAQDVQAAVRGDPVSAAPPTAAYRLRKFARRHRRAVISASLLAAALVLGMAGTTVGLLRARADRDLARAERRSAQSIAEFLQRTLASVGPSVALGRDTAMLREIMDNAAARIDAGELADNPAAEMRLRRTIGATYAEIARFDEAQAMLSRALDLARAGAGGPDDASRDLAVADVLHQIAGLKAQYLRRMAEAEPIYREEIELRRRHNPRDHVELAEALSGVAGALEGQHRLDDALVLHREVLEMQRRLAAAPGADGRGNDPLANSMHALAGCLEVMGRSAEAEPLYREALRMRTQLHPGDHPKVALAINNLAGVLDSLGRADDAAPLYRDALAMRRRLFAGDHPDVFVSLNNMAYSLRSTGRIAEAEEPLRQAVDMARRLFKGDHALLADTLGNLALLMMKLGRPADALPPATEAHDMQRRLFGPTSRESADALVTLTGVLMALDRRDQAEPLLRELLVLLDAQHPGDHSRKAGAMAHLARCINAHTDPAARAEALDLARRAAEMAARILPEGQAVRTRCEKTLAELESTQPPAAAAQEQPAK